MTLIPSVAAVNSRLIMNINKVLKAIQSFAQSYWKVADEVASNIQVTKIDFTTDLKGAFLCNNKVVAYSLIRTELKKCIKNIVENEDWFAFYNRYPMKGPRLRDGCNNFETCFQFEVIDQNNFKVLNIKLYDKITELIGRDGC
jgi:hypothetical protein